MKLIPEQLKGKIRAFSEKNSLKAQEVLQMVMFEQLLSRIEKSSYKDNFIIKGGVLIASLIGIDSRTTMDLDTTIKGLKMEMDNIERVVKEIIDIEIDVLKLLNRKLTDLEFETIFLKKQEKVNIN